MTHQHLLNRVGSNGSKCMYKYRGNLMIQWDDTVPVKAAFVSIESTDGGRNQAHFGENQAVYQVT